MVPKIWKKKAKEEFKKEQKKTAKSLVEALKREGKSISAKPKPKFPTNPKNASTTQSPNTNGGSKKRKEMSGNNSSSASASSSKGGSKQPFMSKKFKTGNGQPKPVSSAAQPQKQQSNVHKDYRSSKPNFQLIENLKPIWNKIRERSTSDKVRAELVQRLVKQMTGKILQVTLRHDASRVVQCILQYGTKEQRKSILEELAQKVVEIAKTPYGHFTVLKAISYCTEADERKKIASAFQGSFRTLGCNVIGARAVESLVQLYPPALTKDLRAEFYGHKFTILLPYGAPKSLRELIAGTPESKHQAIFDHMRDLVHRFCDKGLLEFTFAHELLWEYVAELAQAFALEAASSSGAVVVGGVGGSQNAKRMEDMVAQLGDAAPKLMSTKPGTRVVCHVIGHAGAKDRKRIMKSLKGKVLESLCHDAAYLAIMRIVDATDDTVSVQKMMLEEIRDVKPVLKYTADGSLIGTPYPPLISVAKHRFGCKFLYRLLGPQHQHLEPDEVPLFALSEGQSRKAASVKRAEHLAYLKAPLITVTSRFAHDLVRCRAGSRVLRLVAEVFYPKALLEALVAVFSGVEVVSDVALDEGGGDNEEDEFDDEEDEEDEGDEEHEGMDEDQEGEDEDEETEPLDKDGSDWGDDEDVPPESTETAAPAKRVNLPPAPPLLPIHEDPMAHQTLKHLLQLEAAVEKHSESKTQTLDSSLWEEGSWRGEGAARLAQPLFSAISNVSPDNAGDAPALSAWLACNRACYALGVMIEVPSVKPDMIKVLSQGPMLEALRAAATKHEGGKQLLGLITAAGSVSAQASTGKKGKAAAKGSKK